ncbi:hypothetical protein Hhel01_04152 [Haloferula helveola]
MLIALPILVAQWIGVIAVGKIRRGGAFWCMLAGTILSSIGMVAMLTFSILMTGRASAGLGGLGMEWWSSVIPIMSACSTFGSLLFAIGFAIHALSVRRMHERISELESVIGAQQDQLGRLESGQS